MLPLIDWQAPAPCPDAAAMHQRLGAALQSLPGGWEPAATVRGRISGGAGKDWVLELELELGSSQSGGTAARRRLTAPHCDELADAAAVAIVLALGAGDGAQQLAQSEPPARPLAEPPGAASIVDEAGSAGSAPERPAPWRLAFAAEAVLDSGLLAGVGRGAAAGVQLQRGGWSAGVYGLWLPGRARRRRSAEESSGGAVVWPIG